MLTHDASPVDDQPVAGPPHGATPNGSTLDGPTPDGSTSDDTMPSVLVGLPDFMQVAILQRRREEEAAWLERQQHGDAVAERALRFRGGSRNGASVVFSLRLSHADFAALQRQAAQRSIPPSVLARNLIHCGLKNEPPAYVPRSVGDLDALAQRVRRAGRS